MADEPVGIAVVANEMEADIVCGRLRSEGIRCNHRVTDMAAAGNDGLVSAFGPREIYVAPADAERARALLDSAG